MDPYQTEDEQVEAIKKWWKENGNSVVFGIIFGLLAIFGWREWQDYQREQSEAASALYQELLVSITDGSDDLKNIDQLVDSVTNDYGNTAYPVFTKLNQAKLAVEKNNLDDAEKYLSWALENNSDKNLDLLIRLRLARILASREKFDDAEKLLDIENPGQFAADYHELRGDIATWQGDMNGALTSYQLAITKKASPDDDISILEMKRNDIGHVEIQ